MRIKKGFYILVLILPLMTSCNRQVNHIKQDISRSGTSLYGPGEMDGQSIKGRITALSVIDDRASWVGGEGFIARTQNGGVDWKVLYKGEQTIQQIYTLTSEHVWVVLGLDEPQIMSTRDGGLNWESVGKMPEKGYLHFISQDEGFVNNAYTRDSGKTWIQLQVPDQLIGYPYFYDEDFGWVVTEEADRYTIQRTVDGGKTWHSVMRKTSIKALVDARIRSQGPEDAWVEWVGASENGQTPYTLFHTATGGSQWTTVLANGTSSGDLAPGVEEGDSYHINKGSMPGPLYAVNDQVAFKSGYSPAYDLPNTIGWTTDGGLTWTHSDVELPGTMGSLLGMADAKNGWWICTNEDNSILYTTSDGGENWTEKSTFGK